MNQRVNLTDENKEKIEKLSALDRSPEDIAIICGFHDVALFVEAAEDPTSNVSYHIKRGKLMSAVNEEMALLSDAWTGDVQSGQRLSEIRRARGWKVSREDIFAGFENPKKLEAVQDYLESGASADISAEEQIYLDALGLFHSLSRKVGRRATVGFFEKQFGLRYQRASEMYDEAINLFYADRKVERDAMRNQLADSILEGAAVVRNNAETSKDWKIYGDMLMQAAKLKKLDEQEEEETPIELFQKPLRIMSLSVTDIGLSAINRHELADEIKALEIPESDKLRLLQDARVESFNLMERLSNQTEKD